MSTGPTHRKRRGLPRAAERLRLPIYQEAQRRMRERHGFDVNAPDAPDRARSVRAERPLDPGGAIVLAAVLASRGEDQGAEAEARAAVALGPQLARAHTSLASLLMLRGDTVGALEQAHMAASLDPRDPTVLYNLGLAEHAAGNGDLARRAFGAAEDALAGRDPAAAAGAKRHWWQRG